MKHSTLFFISFITIFLVGCSQKNTTELVPSEPTPLSQESVTEASQTAQLIINFGDTTLESDVDTQPEASVLDALTTAADQEELSLEIEEYDFGSLVTSIDGRANSNEFVWIYYINDQSATVGADQQTISPGDTIEWSYEALE